MRMLLIGMDGAQSETFRRGWTPFLESIIDNGTSLSLKEDLISRGWAEIMTGEHAIVTGAMYERPIMDGTHKWTDKFKMDDIPGLGSSIKPLWQVLNERGYSVGIMNVPTTYPAPEVNGFFVSGGGGGGPISQDITTEQCHPASIKERLNGMAYILDERLPSLLSEKGLYQPDAFFHRLGEMTQKRTGAFIELSRQHKIDFGFVVYRSSVTTETLLLPELQRYCEGDTNVNRDFLNAAERFYRAFDEQMRRLIQTFPEAEVALVSDHSMVPRRWSVNPNAFLVEKGYQKRSVTGRGIFDFVKSLRHLIPYSIRRKLKDNPSIKSAYESMITFDPHDSLAFNITLTNAIHGIYINDKERFGGPVEPSDVSSLQDSIIRDFNQHPIAVEHGLSASKPEIGGECSKLFPDIIIEMPDGYAPSNVQPRFITEYLCPVKPMDLKKMRYDKRISVKGHHPLAVIMKGGWLVHPSSEKADLRLVYDHVLATFHG